MSDRFQTDGCTSAMTFAAAAEPIRASGLGWVGLPFILVLYASRAGGIVPCGSWAGKNLAIS